MRASDPASGARAAMGAERAAWVPFRISEISEKHMVVEFWVVEYSSLGPFQISEKTEKHT